MKNNYLKKKKLTKQRHLPSRIVPLAGYRTLIIQIISNQFYKHFEDGSVIISANANGVSHGFKKSVMKEIELKIGMENLKNVEFDIGDMIRDYAFTMLQTRDEKE